ncbi:MAG: hypothetical protein ACM3ZE_30035 [Myxococcales bacterium]
MSPQLRSLVTATKAANLPSEAARMRVLQALEVQLGHSAILESGSTISAATGPTAIVKVAALSAVGIALLGGAAWLQWGASKQPSTQPVQATTVLSAAAEPVDRGNPVASVTVEDLPLAAATEPKANAHGTPNKGRNRDRLAEEVAVISRAQGEIAAARLDSALRILDEHERKFPNGILTEERIAARVQALCALGRTTEATAQLNRLSPRSLHHRGPSQTACGAGTKSASKKSGSPAASN